MNIKYTFPVIIGMAIGLSGCTHKPSTRPTIPVIAAHEVQKPKPAPATQPTPISKTKIRPSEAGLVPILEYHEIGPINPKRKRSEKDMFRSPAAFRRDLERLYKEGYRPITLKSYLDNRIDLPPGKKPVILTFDDARSSQFRYLPNGKLDPQCAIGIMQSFAKKYPDFPPIGTFYVLPTYRFGQKETGVQKMQALVKMGCELGNHTVTHAKLHRISEKKIQEEIAMGAALIQKLVPGVKVETLALPGGHMPRRAAIAVKGSFKGMTYYNRAVLLAGDRPAPSPITRKYNPARLPRILAVEGPGGVTYWLNYLKKNAKQVYVSDGNPKTITIPRTQVAAIDKNRLKGAILQTY